MQLAFEMDDSRFHECVEILQSVPEDAREGFMETLERLGITIGTIGSDVRGNVNVVRMAFVGDFEEARNKAPELQPPPLFEIRRGPVLALVD